MSAVLQRTTFETSRALEYFTEKELQAQIGSDPPFWPVAILRELIDNALDACEESGTAPEIEITMEGNDSFTVKDNGPGIPAEVIERSLDYFVRVSSRAYYVSPTRGQMGNALKVIWAAPFVAAGAGTIEVVAQRKHHIIEIALDRIGQKPKIKHSATTTDVKTGTTVKIRWADSARLLRGETGDSYKRPPTAAHLIACFVAFNPHATFIINGKRKERVIETSDKWAPNQPTSAHWYSTENFRDLIAAYIAAGRSGTQKTVREFVSEFRGLSSTIKQKAVTDGWTGKRLADFVVDGDIDKGFVAMLLKRMQDASTPPPAKALGSIGKEHWTAWMIAHGVTPASIKYFRKAGIDGLPYVLEFAFGVMAGDTAGRRIITGLNWSPVIGSDPDPLLREVIAQARLDQDDPVILLVHIARPRFQFVDRGKTRVAL